MGGYCFVLFPDCVNCRWRESGSSYDLLVRLLEECGPVGEAACHQAGVDEVEFFLVNPFVFCVVDYELEVWRYSIVLGQ